MKPLSPKNIASDDEQFLAQVLDRIAAVASLESRPMFGGHGLYSSGKFFGIVWRGRVFFRTNEHTAPQYVSVDAAYFQSGPNQTLKQFFEVPAAVVERPGELLRWAIQAASI